MTRTDWDVHSLRERFNSILVRSVPDLPVTGFSYSSIANGPAGGCANSAYLTQMTENDLRLIINNMSAVKAHGNDGIRLRDILANFNKRKHVLLKYPTNLFQRVECPEA